LLTRLAMTPFEMRCPPDCGANSRLFGQGILYLKEFENDFTTQNIQRAFLVKENARPEMPGLYPSVFFCIKCILNS
jgi:hypothetical protein